MQRYLETEDSQLTIQVPVSSLAERILRNRRLARGRRAVEFTSKLGRESPYRMIPEKTFRPRQNREVLKSSCMADMPSA